MITYFLQILSYYIWFIFLVNRRYSSKDKTINTSPCMFKLDMLPTAFVWECCKWFWHRFLLTNPTCGSIVLFILECVEGHGTTGKNIWNWYNWLWNSPMCWQLGKHQYQDGKTLVNVLYPILVFKRLTCNYLSFTHSFR